MIVRELVLQRDGAVSRNLNIFIQCLQIAINTLRQRECYLISSKYLLSFLFNLFFSSQKTDVCWSESILETRKKEKKEHQVKVWSRFAFIYTLFSILQPFYQRRSIRRLTLLATLIENIRTIQARSSQLGHTRLRT